MTIMSTCSIKLLNSIHPHLAVLTPVIFFYSTKSSCINPWILDSDAYNIFGNMNLFFNFTSLLIPLEITNGSQAMVKRIGMFKLFLLYL